MIARDFSVSVPAKPLGILMTNATMTSLSLPRRCVLWTACILAPFTLATGPASAQLFGFGLAAPATTSSPMPPPAQPVAAEPQSPAQAASAPAAHRPHKHHRAAQAVGKPLELPSASTRPPQKIPGHARPAQEAKATPEADDAHDVEATQVESQHRARRHHAHGIHAGRGKNDRHTLSADDKPLPGESSKRVYREAPQWTASSAR